MAYGSGSLYQRTSDKLWVGQYSVEGKKRYVYGRTKKAAREKLAEATAARTRGDTVAARRQTLGAYLYWWVETMKSPPHVDIRTHDQYAAVLARIYTRIGHVSLDKLRDDHITGCYREMRKEGLKPATVNGTHRVLKSALKYAVATRRMAHNPLDVVPAPPMKQEEKLRWTQAEVDRFLDQLKENRWHPLWTVLADTGMRIGEALALRWQDVDGDVIHIRQALHYGSGQRHTGSVKTKNSERDIPMPASVKVAIERRRLDQKRERMRCKIWTTTGLVFTQLDGTMLVPSSARDALMRQARLRGYPPITTHDFRHLFASRGARLHIHPSVMQQILGHSHINITLTVYTHVEEEMVRAAMDQLAEGRSA